MTETTSRSTAADGQDAHSSATYLRWGGLAAMLGPLLVLVANGYGVWRTVGSGPESIVDAAVTTPYLVFGSLRLLGGTLLVFGLVALYAYQLETAGRMGVVGFVVAMIGTALLTGSAWYQLFIVPAMAADVPTFTEAVRAANVGQWTLIGLLIPILAQSLGWVVFGIATYRARVFPNWVAAGVVLGALLLLIPVPGIPVVFQLAVASMGYLVFSGRLETPAQDLEAGPSQSESVGS